MLDVLCSMWSNQARARRSGEAPSIASLSRILVPNRGLRGKVFETVLVEGINRFDLRLVRQLQVPCRTFRIECNRETFGAVHVAFDQASAAERIKQSLAAQGWTPPIQYLDGRVGRPVEFYSKLDDLAASISRPAANPHVRLLGAEKADLIIGCKSQIVHDRPVARVFGVTVKLDEFLLERADHSINVRAAMFAANEESVEPYLHSSGMWRIPVPQTFMRDFHAAWLLSLYLLVPDKFPEAMTATLRRSSELERIRRWLARRATVTFDDLVDELAPRFGDIGRLWRLKKRVLDPLWSDPATARTWLELIEETANPRHEE